MSTSLSAYQTLEKLAVKEVTTGSFPTHFTIVLRLRSAMSDRQAPHKRLISLMNGEPVVSAKLIQAANLAIHYETERVTNIGRAIEILGSSAVRRIALGVAMAQLVSSKHLLDYANVSRSIWLHSLETACAASVIAETMTSINPEEAFFAGLVVNLGAFYLLYRAALARGLSGNTDEVVSATRRHNASLTKRVLTFLGIPSKVIECVDMTEFSGIVMVNSPKTMKEVIQAAVVLSMEDHPWNPSLTEDSRLSKNYIELRPRIMAIAASLQNQYTEL